MRRIRVRVMCIVSSLFGEQLKPARTCAAPAKSNIRDRIVSSRNSSVGMPLSAVGIGIARKFKNVLEIAQRSRSKCPKNNYYLDHGSIRSTLKTFSKGQGIAIQKS